MNEYNCAGVLVHARLGQADAVEQLLKTLPGVDVHARDDTGRLVVTVEDVDSNPCARTLSNLHEIDGVLSAAVVYQQSDQDEPELETQS